MRVVLILFLFNSCYSMNYDLEKGNKEKMMHDLHTIEMKNISNNSGDQEISIEENDIAAKEDNECEEQPPKLKCACISKKNRRLINNYYLCTVITIFGGFTAGLIYMLADKMS